MSRAYTVLPGRLLVLRDPEIKTVELKQFGEKPIVLHTPDDMASSGVNSWAASDRIRSSGICLLHQPSGAWVHDPPLTKMHVWWEKYTELAFDVEGHTFHVVPEQAIYAYAEESDDDEG